MPSPLLDLLDSFLFLSPLLVSLFHAPGLAMSVEMVEFLLPLRLLAAMRVVGVTCRITSLHHRARDNTAGTVVATPAGEFDTRGDAFDCCVRRAGGACGGG